MLAPSRPHATCAQVWPSLESTVSARVAAAADYPGNQTISREAAAMLVRDVALAQTLLMLA
jgi:hypothetical protein